MSNIINNLPNGNCLIISNGAGSGHVEATKYLKQELATHRLGIKVFTSDVLTMSLGTPIGTWAIEDWNKKLKDQNVEALNNTLNYQWADELFSPIAFFVFLIYFFKNDIDSVVSTQPLSNVALIRAARLVNFIRRIFNSVQAQITIKLILTELPTQHTANFLRPLKKLYESDRAILQLVTTNPLVVNAESEEKFWLDNTGLSRGNNEVSYEPFPIRQKFKDLEGRDPKALRQLDVLCASAEERELIEKCYGEGAPLRDEQAQKEKVIFPIAPEDKVNALMLGGQACKEATLEYVSAMINAAKAVPSNEKQFLFVFCGRHQAGQESLFKKVADLVIEAKNGLDYPEKLKVIPLTYQTDEEIAPILFRSDVSITKSGGLTSMELLTVAHGKVLIHAHVENEENLNENQLMIKGMPLWERGNAEYLRQKIHAQIVTPAGLQARLSA